MIMARQIILSLIVVCIATTAALALTIAKNSDDDPQLPRVIIRVDRNHEVPGYVEEEDETIIVIRKLDGEIESYSKTRIAMIVRLAEAKPGQIGTVILRNGQRREGIIIEDIFDHVLIEAEGIRAKLLRETVDYVILRPTFDQQYKSWKAAIGPEQYVDHYRLCEWLVNQRKYALTERFSLPRILIFSFDSLGFFGFVFCSSFCSRFCKSLTSFIFGSSPNVRNSSVSLSLSNCTIISPY